MLRVTDDVLELRSWAEERGGQPCRQPDGRLTVCFGTDPAARRVGWDEFEVAFLHEQRAFVHDDAPGCTHCFIGSADEARAYVARYAPHLTGPAPAHPPRAE